MTSIFTTDPEEREKKWRDLVVLMKEDGLVHDEELQTLEQEVHRAAELFVQRNSTRAQSTIPVVETWETWEQIFCKFLAGSFSAVSKQNFARKYAFDSIFQALQDLHTFAPLQSQNFRKKSV